jgi:uncharacterized protein
MPEESRKAQRLDPRAPFVLAVRELGRRPGAMSRVSRTVPAPADLGLAVVGVPEGSDLELSARLESVVEGVLVSGTARVWLTGECVRCLDPVTGTLAAEFQELYVYPEREADDEASRLEGDLLDLEPLLRDAVVLALPLQPVCRDDCPGLCSQCGAHLALDPGHRHEAVDPRWEVLRGFADRPVPPDESQ